MNIDVFKNQLNFLDKIQVKKAFLSFCLIIILFLEFFINNKNGTIASWGTPHLVYLFSISISNIDLFFILVFIGNFLILITSFPFVENNYSFITKKQLQTLGLLLYFIGILSYFNFLFYEPFIFLYLLFVAIIYVGLSTFHFSVFSFNFQIPFFYQPNFDYSTIMRDSLWNYNTKKAILRFFETNTFDFALVLLILFLFFQLAILILEKSSFLTKQHAQKLNIFTESSILLKDSFPNRMKIVYVFLFCQYSLLFILLINKDFILVFISLITLIPFYKSQSIKLFIKEIHFLKVKIYDLYILNLFIIILFTYLLGFITSDVSYFILFLFSLWIAIKTFDLIKNYNQKNIPFNTSRTLIEVNYRVISKNLYALILLIYMVSWMTSIDESFYFSLFFFSTILMISPFLIRNFLRPEVLKYAFRRFLLIIPMLIGISIIIFYMVAINSIPQYILEHYPVQNQWFNWFFQFFLGDFGRDTAYGYSPISYIISTKIGPSLEITLIPIVIAVTISIMLGIYSYKKLNTIKDNFVQIFVALSISIPTFVLILLMMLIFSLELMMLPPQGTRLVGLSASQVKYAYSQAYAFGLPINFNLIFNGQSYFSFHTVIKVNSFFSWAKYDFIFHMVMPVFCVSILSLGLYTRLVRSEMVEVMRKDYITSARASGFSEKTIINKYALRNAILPLLTFIGLNLGFILGGAPIIETILNWPGLGQYFVQAIDPSNFDLDAIMAISMILSLTVLLSNLVTDILYGIVDPRITIE